MNFSIYDVCINRYDSSSVHIKVFESVGLLKAKKELTAV